MEVPWASLSFITRTRVGPGSLLMDVSFGFCLTVIHYKAMSGCSWGLGCLTFSWLSLCPFPCPRVAIQAYLVDDKPAEESTRAAQRKVGLWEDTGHNPTNESMSILPQALGARARGWGMVIANMPWALRGCLPAVLFSSQQPHGHAYHQPYFTEGKTEVHGDKWLAPDHTVRKYSTRGQSQLDKDLPLCLRYRKMIGIILFHCIRNTI